MTEGRTGIGYGERENVGKVRGKKSPSGILLEFHSPRWKTNSWLASHRSLPVTYFQRNNEDSIHLGPRGQSTAHVIIITIVMEGD